MNQPTKVVRNHDFRRTDLLERADLQTVQGPLETFSRSATLKFTSTLRQPCFFDVETLDQVTWRDLVEGFASGTYFFTFSLHPLPGHAVFVIPTEEALALVDLRLAGSGEDDFSGRIPSEIDQDFLASIVDDLIAELAAAFGRIQATMPVLEAQEGNVQFVSISSAAEMCVAVHISLTIASRSTCEALICLPFPMVRMLLDTLQSKTGPVIDGRFDSYAAATRQRLKDVPVNVVFQFPSFMTTPAELLTLRVGDSLGLGHPKGRPLEVRAEGLLVGLADICSSGVHKACEIKEEVTK